MMGARRQQRGFTLIELMITLAVAGIVLMASVPPFVNMFTRIRVEGTGNELSADLQFARTEAVRRRTIVSLATTSGGAGYRITMPDPVTSGAVIQLKGVDFATGLRVTEGIVTVSYDAMRAMANESVLTLSDASDRAQLRVAVNAMGRVEMCSPGHTISNYPSC